MMASGAQGALFTHHPRNGSMEDNVPHQWGSDIAMCGLQLVFGNSC